MNKRNFESKELVIALLIIAGGVIFLETIALLRGIDGTFFGLATAGLGTIGGYLLKGYLKK